MIVWWGKVLSIYHKNGTVRVMDFSHSIPKDYIREIGKPFKNSN